MLFKKLKEAYYKFRYGSKYSIELVVLTKAEYLRLKKASDKYYLLSSKEAYRLALEKTENSTNKVANHG